MVYGKLSAELAASDAVAQWRALLFLILRRRAKSSAGCCEGMALSEGCRGESTLENVRSSRDLSRQGEFGLDDWKS